MFYFLNKKNNSIWEENNKVLLMKNEQEVQQAGNIIMNRFRIEQQGINGNQQFVMQGIDPNAPMLILDEWIDGLFQGFETITFQEWISKGGSK